jgi:hypothetical protein
MCQIGSDLQPANFRLDRMGDIRKYNESVIELFTFNRIGEILIIQLSNHNSISVKVCQNNPILCFPNGDMIRKK